MKLFLISRKDRWSYDDYDSAVVCAETEEIARRTHPGNQEIIDWTKDQNYSTWVRHPELIDVKYLGEADPGVLAGIVCASFNAG